jgi:hypothetical protein
VNSDNILEGNYSSNLSSKVEGNINKKNTADYTNEKQMKTNHPFCTVQLDIGSVKDEKGGLANHDNSSWSDSIGSFLWGSTKDDSTVLSAPTGCKNVQCHILLVYIFQYYIYTSYLILFVLFSNEINKGSFGYVTRQLLTEVCPPEATAWEELLIARAVSVAINTIVDQSIAIVSGMEDALLVSVKIIKIKKKIM